MTAIINAIINFLILYIGSITAPSQIQITDWKTAVVFTGIYTAATWTLNFLLAPIEANLAEKQARAIISGQFTWQVRIIGIIQLVFPFLCFLFGNKFVTRFHLTTGAAIIVTILFFALEYTPQKRS